MNISNVKVIESSLKEAIKVGLSTMFVFPCKSLDELEFWENRLEDLDVDYVLAEFDATYKDEDSGKHVQGKRFSLFTNTLGFTELDTDESE